MLTVSPALQRGVVSSSGVFQPEERESGGVCEVSAQRRGEQGVGGGGTLSTEETLDCGAAWHQPADPACFSCRQPEHPACITGFAARASCLHRLHHRQRCRADSPARTRTAPGSGACPQRCQEAPAPPVPQSLPDCSHWISGEDLIFAGTRPPKPRKGNFFPHLKLRARSSYLRVYGVM
ncbi:hypothetical protein NDU88_003180 [Pleurodeles waltl]|uniref:Uncharacterized protein n=1 Tax=Pleurodeles waltl TaxID=8319 RepID=A0AAV7NQ78_PLEWA|nr:hypothetical protein NDU88_003180 [Pleurodeles waltl]